MCEIYNGICCIEVENTVLNMSSTKLNTVYLLHNGQLSVSKSFMDISDFVLKDYVSRDFAFILIETVKKRDRERESVCELYQVNHLGLHTKGRKHFYHSTADIKASICY